MSAKAQTLKPREIPSSQWNDWRWQIRNASRSAGCEKVESRYPFFATPYILRLAKKSQYVRKQVFPDNRELDAEPGAAPDPFAERTESAKTYGLKQRFPDRALIMTSDACSMFCRHCTRKNILHRAQVADTPERIAKCARYIKARPEIRDVLLSGGDALMNSDRRIKELIEAFASMPQIDVVRVCTRMPSTLPMRITPALVKILSRSKKVWVNTHFNCADEITPEAGKACSMLVDAGIPVSCQSVLLKGVNDTPNAMLSLLKALQRIRVRPYYVFLCDPVCGISHFRVPLEKARELELAVASHIGGLAMPKFVADIPGSKRKIPIAELL